MARLSDDRISTLARQSLEALRKAGKILDERLALGEAKRVLSEQFQLEDRLEQAVRSKIPPRVVPGSREWDVQYRRIMEEEIRKRRG